MLYRVDRRKITHYLLDPDHPIGKSKCTLFLHNGFEIDDPERLASALVTHAVENSTGASVLPGKPFPKVAVFGPLRTPSGRSPNAFSIWEVTGATQWRLVTAYIR